MTDQSEGTHWYVILDGEQAGQMAEYKGPKNVLTVQYQGKARIIDLDELFGGEVELQFTAGNKTG